MHGGHLSDSSATMRAFLALSTLLLAFTHATEHVHPGVEPVYAQPPQNLAYADPHAQLYPEQGYVPYEKSEAEKKNDLIDRQLEAFAAGPLATLVSIGLAGAIALGFVTSQAEDGRKDLQTEIDTMEKELAALEASYLANEKKIDAVCAGILQSAWVNFADILTIGNLLPSGTTAETNFKKAVNDIYVWIRLHQITDKDNRCLAKLSNS